MYYYHVRLQVMDVLEHFIAHVTTVLRRDAAFFFHVTHEITFVLITSTAVIRARPSSLEVIYKQIKNMSLNSHNVIRLVLIKQATTA